MAAIGASTGGFTDCLLTARHASMPSTWAMGSWPGPCVQDPRVVVMERTNARYVEALPGPSRW